MPRHLKPSFAKDRYANLFYFTGNEDDIPKLKYFEEDLDSNLQQKIIFKDSIPEAFE